MTNAAIAFIELCSLLLPILRHFRLGPEVGLDAVRLLAFGCRVSSPRHIILQCLKKGRPNFAKTSEFQKGDMKKVFKLRIYKY